MKIRVYSNRCTSKGRNEHFNCTSKKRTLQGAKNLSSLQIMRVFHPWNNCQCKKQELYIVLPRWWIFFFFRPSQDRKHHHRNSKMTMASEKCTPDGKHLVLPK
mmetsp:Transcript_6347/g.13724  ORF Transcript_6347/g.13724 Transcript_6347/m.13724 type:complete len:103 (+) Transcript_6347:334-642(+)